MTTGRTTRSLCYRGAHLKVPVTSIQTWHQINGVHPFQKGMTTSVDPSGSRAKNDRAEQLAGALG